MSFAPPSVSGMFSAAAISISLLAMSPGVMRRKSNRWQRDRMVAGTLWISVVARMKSTWDGGSSSVFSRALNAPRGQHMHLVDDVHALFDRGRRIARLLTDVADVVHAHCSRPRQSQPHRAPTHPECRGRTRTRRTGSPFFGCSQLTARARIWRRWSCPCRAYRKRGRHATGGR